MRLPTHLEVSGLIRAVEAAGGHAMVLHKGEWDAGTLLIVATFRQSGARLYERMPSLDGARKFEITKHQDTENPSEFDEYLARRSAQDPDIWVLEVDVADPEPLIASLSE